MPGQSVCKTILRSVGVWGLPIWEDSTPLAAQLKLPAQGKASGENQVLWLLVGIYIKEAGTQAQSKTRVATVCSLLLWEVLQSMPDNSP